MAKDGKNKDAIDLQQEDDGQVYVEREKIDFDPADGLYSGTAVDGSTDIPGPHEREDAGDAQPASDQEQQPSDEQQAGADQDGQPQIPST